MPTIIKQQLVKGEKYSTSFDKTSVTRVFHVQVEAGLDPAFMSYAAANCDGIPRRGDIHPALNQLSCRSISAQPYSDNAPTVFVVTVEYGAELDKSRQTPTRNGPCTLEYGTATASLKVFRGWSKSGDFGPMILKFTDPNVDLPTQAQLDAVQGNALFAFYNSGKLRLQPCEFDMQVPMPLVTFRRNEPADGFDYVTFKTLFEGHINSQPFLGKVAFTWLCVKIDAQLRNDSFECAYTFQYHGHIEPFDWNPIFVFKEYSGKGRGKNAPGAPADGVDFQNGGIEQFRVYPLADFRSMGLGNA